MCPVRRRSPPAFPQKYPSIAADCQTSLEFFSALTVDGVGARVTPERYLAIGYLAEYE
jgi:hypothetical protein